MYLIWLKAMKKCESFSISGQSFKILDQFLADCSKCGTRHQLIELSRDFIVEEEFIQHHVERRCMYCTVTGDLFVTPEQHEENKTRIYNAVSSDPATWARKEA